MTTTDTTLIELIGELSPTSRESLRDFVEFLVTKQRRELAEQAEANGWSDGFFELAGSIADLTFVRPPQGRVETRLSLE